MRPSRDGLGLCRVNEDLVSEQYLVGLLSASRIPVAKLLL